MQAMPAFRAPGRGRQRDSDAHPMRQTACPRLAHSVRRYPPEWLCAPQHGYNRRPTHTALPTGSRSRRAPAGRRKQQHPPRPPLQNNALALRQLLYSPSPQAANEHARRKLRRRRSGAMGHHRHHRRGHEPHPVQGQCHKPSRLQIGQHPQRPRAHTLRRRRQLLLQPPQGCVRHQTHRLEPLWGRPRSRGGRLRLAGPLHAQELLSSQQRRVPQQEGADRNSTTTSAMCSSAAAALRRSLRHRPSIP